MLTLRASAGFLNTDVQDGTLATGSIRGQLHLDMNYNCKQYLALPNEGAISPWDVGTPRMYGFDAHYHF